MMCRVMNLNYSGFVRNIHLGLASLKAHIQRFPSIVFGLEQAFYSLRARTHCIFNTSFTKQENGIPINGLIWMDSIEKMRLDVGNKIKSGFTTIKIKIGALDFDLEMALLQDLRHQYPVEQITFRLDANGAFHPEDVDSKLARIAQLGGVHSIEQPIAPKYIG